MPLTLVFSKRKSVDVTLFALEEADGHPKGVWRPRSGITRSTEMDLEGDNSKEIFTEMQKKPQWTPELHLRAC
jgi:hypothetical protein